MSNTKTRIEFLDYVKAVCVCLVIITHYDWQEKNTIPFLMVINMAVPVFMMVSGYNFAMSYKKKTNGNLAQMYRFDFLLQRVERIFSPFFVICLVELGFIIAQNKHINLPRIFLWGAYGPGSYYVPLLIQLLLVFPLIYKLMEAGWKVGLFSVGAINLLYEIGVVIFDMENEDYRLCIGRYLFLIALGCLLYMYPEVLTKRRYLVLMFLFGLLYIVTVLCEVDMVLFAYWTPTVMPIAFYIFPIMVVLFKRFYYSHIPGKIGEILSEIGKASYHIYLVQMVYYHFEVGREIMNLEWYFAIPYNLLITITVGVLFFEVEQRIRSKKHFNVKKYGIFYGIPSK